MDAIVRPQKGSAATGNPQFSSPLSRLSMDGDSDSDRSERLISSLVAGPALLQTDAANAAATAAFAREEVNEEDENENEEPDDEDDDDDDDDDEDDDDDDDYECQDVYVYDISWRLKEVNAAHFAEPMPTPRSNKVRFADDPVDRVLCYSPTPLPLDVDERLQMKKEYLMKLFAKDDSELGENESDESDLFSSSDDEDFIDRSNKMPSPIVEMPRTPSPPRSSRREQGSRPGDQVQDQDRDTQSYSSHDDETEEGDSADDENVKSRSSRPQAANTSVAANAVDADLDSKIMELLERSVKSSDYQAGSNDSARNLANQIKHTVEESRKSATPQDATESNSFVRDAAKVNGKLASDDQLDQNGAKESPADAQATRLNDRTLDQEHKVLRQGVATTDLASSSPEPPSMTLNNSTQNMVRQNSVDRQLPKDLPIRSVQVDAKSPHPTSPTSLPASPPAARLPGSSSSTAPSVSAVTEAAAASTAPATETATKESPPPSAATPLKSTSNATGKSISPTSPRRATTSAKGRPGAATVSTPAGRGEPQQKLNVPTTSHAAVFPPSPTRFIRKSAAPVSLNGAGGRRSSRGPPAGGASATGAPSSTAVSESATAGLAKVEASPTTRTSTTGTLGSAATSPTSYADGHAVTAGHPVVARKLPTYTGNERSRYGLPAEEKAKLREERERLRREKEEKMRREEEEKRQRKLDAQKTFEAWLRNKHVGNSENSRRTPTSGKKKALSPQPPDEGQSDTSTSPNTTVTFLTWLKGKKIQERQRRLQEKLQQLELEELERKHTRQDAQQAYKRWLRKKAFESEQLRLSQQQRAVEAQLSSSCSSRSKEALDRFFESEDFASLSRHGATQKETKRATMFAQQPKATRTTTTTARMAAITTTTTASVINTNANANATTSLVNGEA